MKQTVEEAAEKEALDHGKGFYSQAVIDDLEAFFIKGAAWQREQGIDWISVAERLPEIEHVINQIGASYTMRVLVTNGRGYDFSQAVFQQNGNHIGWLGDYNPTHWAYINLPKTDK